MREGFSITHKLLPLKAMADKSLWPSLGMGGLCERTAAFPALFLEAGKAIHN